MKPETLTITRPDDWHVHLRDGDVLPTTVMDTARQFARAIVMPNLSPPITTTEQAHAYAARIRAVLPPGLAFTPLMTLYLTDDTSPKEVFHAKQSEEVVAFKLYPAGATTNSASGVTDISRLNSVFEEMQAHGVPLLVHAEVTDEDVDIFDREEVFLERVLEPLMGRFPTLRVVLEHVSTRAGVEFIKRSPRNVGATITAHHLLLTRNDLLVGGIRPHHYCLPVVKRETDRLALLEAAASGDPKFFLGTDSAPHSRAAKESACGSAGIYTAHAALALYAEAFEQCGALDKLERFASLNGPVFYDLPTNSEKITLVREPWHVPETLAFGHEKVVPMRAGARVQWRIPSL